jgi:hypothetical protein
MNGITSPILFFRRLVNVISTLSLSNQYLLLKQARAEDKAEWKKPTWIALNSLKIPEWRWVLWNTAPVASQPGGPSILHGAR